jgi:hypothetical protein
LELNAINAQFLITTSEKVTCQRLQVCGAGVGWGRGGVNQKKNRNRNPLPVSKLELKYYFVKNNIFQLSHSLSGKYKCCSLL